MARIQLTESELKRIIKESVIEIINEEDKKRGGLIGWTSKKAKQADDWLDDSKIGPKYGQAKKYVRGKAKSAADEFQNAADEYKRQRDIAVDSFKRDAKRAIKGAGELTGKVVKSFNDGYQSGRGNVNEMQEEDWDETKEKLRNAGEKVKDFTKKVAQSAGSRGPERAKAVGEKIKDKEKLRNAGEKVKDFTKKVAQSAGTTRGPEMFKAVGEKIKDTAKKTYRNFKDADKEWRKMEDEFRRGEYGEAGQVGQAMRDRYGYGSPVLGYGPYEE